MFNDLKDFYRHHQHHHEQHWAGHRGPPRGRGGFPGRGPVVPPFRGGPHHGGPPFGRGGDWFGDFFGPPPRADRGGVRYLVLDALAAQNRHGYEVIQAIEERSGGTYRPSPGVVYPTLQMLEELGHTKVLEQDSRKVHAITDEGRKELDAHRDEVEDFYDRSAPEFDFERQLESFAELKRQASYVFKSFKRAMRRGRLTPEMQLQVTDILRDALKRIEQLFDEAERR